MSCNGCRVLRKGCSETCVLRPCLQWIEGAEAQGHATVFVAKFFGRAGLVSFISAVPLSQRPALFQSLLYEACGRTINPVGGAVGLLSSGNWDLCQAAVDTVLRGDTLRPITALGSFDAHNGTPEDGDLYSRRWSTFSSAKKRKAEPCNLDLCLTPRPAGGDTEEKRLARRPGTPNSEESVTTSAESRAERTAEGFPRLLNLFV